MLVALSLAKQRHLCEKRHAARIPRHRKVHVTSFHPPFIARFALARVVLVLTMPKAEVHKEFGEPEMSTGSFLRRNLPGPLFEALYGARTFWRRQFDFLRLCRDYLHDARRYARWSHSGRADTTLRQREFAILKSYHSIEKGLSLPEPRPGFGKMKINNLITKIDELRSQDPESNKVKAATASINAYKEFNSNHDVMIDWLDAWTKRAVQADPTLGGTETVYCKQIQEATQGVTSEFFLTRHSIRNFGPGEVPIADIEAATLLAQKAPSVCNRQGAKVYCFKQAMDALQYQPGNGGFGYLASRGLVITADLQAFSSVGERHQAYVDGGLFAMSLVYALHSMGYGSCMLAWNQRAAAEARIRSVLGIPENEAIIMMIAVGCLPETLKVARAWRRPLSEVLVVR
jgi:nitroreductase